MTNRIVTYRSLNAEPGMEWMAFIENSKGRLGIYFTAATEEAVKEKVRAFWATEKAKHEAMAGKRKPEAKAA